MKLSHFILASITAMGVMTSAQAAPAAHKVLANTGDTVTIPAGFDGKCRIVDKTNDKISYDDFAAKTLKSSDAEPMQWRVVSVSHKMPKLIEAVSKPSISFSSKNHKANFAADSYNMQCVIAGN